MGNQKSNMMLAIRESQSDRDAKVKINAHLTAPAKSLTLATCLFIGMKKAPEERQFCYVKIFSIFIAKYISPCQ
jgi:hypothetical protein